ncbi:hypothetical protein WMF30_49070 [Sorangium sp. So ce134]
MLDPPAIGLQLVSSPVRLEPGQERYICWTASVPEGEPLAVRSIEALMPADAIHHYQVSIAESAIESGADCDANIDGAFVAVGGPGAPTQVFPEGTALVLDGGTQLFMQLHLMNAGTTPVEVPPAYVNLVGAEHADGLARAGILIVGQGDFLIPANAKDVSVTADCTLDRPLEHTFMVFPHMHMLGRRIQAELVREGGSRVPLVDVDWNFNEQKFYDLDESAAAGERLLVTCTYDNPTPRDVQWGMGTLDEMCTGFVYYYPAVELSSFCLVPDDPT